MTARYLLADLGGTNTRVGLADATGVIGDSVHSFRNSDFDGLAQLLQSYLAQQGTPRVNALCAGVAGPVRDGAAQLTNHAWFIEARALGQTLGIDEVHLINDLQAQGYALDDIPDDCLTPLVPATGVPGGTRLVLGMGTGCNVAVVHATPDGLFVPPAENGHASLPFCEGAPGRFVASLCAEAPHLPIEAALSGPGLVNIHRWLGGGDATPKEILGSATAQSAEARAIFITLLGQVAGDLCLAHLPAGGLFLIGGTARAIAPNLAASEFHARFTDKGPYRHILQDIPVTLITDDMAALHGCARYLRQRAQ